MPGFGGTEHHGMVHEMSEDVWDTTMYVAIDHPEQSMAEDGIGTSTVEASFLAANMPVASSCARSPTQAVIEAGSSIPPVLWAW